MNYWDKAARERGGVLAVLPAFPEWTFTVRQFTNWLPDFQRATARIAAQPDVADYLQRVREPGYVPSEIDQITESTMVRDAFADGCIAGWSDVTGPDGRLLPYSKAAARSILDAIPQLYEGLRSFAMDPKNYAPMSAAAKEALATGNLQPASSS